MYIKVYDNSAEAPADGTVPDPYSCRDGKRPSHLAASDDLNALQRAPEWTKLLSRLRYAAANTRASRVSSPAIR